EILQFTIVVCNVSVNKSLVPGWGCRRSLTHGSRETIRVRRLRRLGDCMSMAHGESLTGCVMEEDCCGGVFGARRRARLPDPRRAHAHVAAGLAKSRGCGGSVPAPTARSHAGGDGLGQQPPALLPHGQ